MVTLLANGAPDVTVRQGDSVLFEIVVEGDAADGATIDFEGSGDWEPVAGVTVRRVFPRPGRFVATVRIGGDESVARVQVTRVTGTGGGGIY